MKSCSLPVVEKNKKINETKRNEKMKWNEMIVPSLLVEKNNTLTNSVSFDWQDNTNLPLLMIKK